MSILVQRSGDITTVTPTPTDRRKRNALSRGRDAGADRGFRESATATRSASCSPRTDPSSSAGHNFGDMAGADLDTARHLFAVCTR